MKPRVSALFVTATVAALSLVGCGGSQSASKTQASIPTRESAQAPSGPAVSATPAETAWKPTKPIEMTVLFGAGSAADRIARTLADGLSTELGQAIVVANRTGGGGAVGYAHVKSQPADGHSIVWNSNSISTAYYAGNMKLSHKDFDAVSMVSVETSAITVKADAPWKTVADLVAYARQNPGKLRIGNSGIGSYTHLTAVAFAKAAGIQVEHVPFGTGLAVTNLVDGRIQASVQLPAEVISQLTGGQVRILGVTSNARDPNLTDVPTLREQHLDMELDLWRGIAVPKGTPANVVKTMDTAIRKIVASPSFREKSKELVFRPAYLESSAFGRLIAIDDARIKDLMNELGLNKQK